MRLARRCIVLLSNWLFPRRQLPSRLVKAAVWGLLSYLIVYVLPLLVFPLDSMPAEYQPLFYFFAWLTIGFTVLGKLVADTLLDPPLAIVRTIIMTGYFIYAFEGGLLTISVPVSDTFLHLQIDLTLILAIIVVQNFLTISKHLLRLLHLQTQVENLDI